MSLSLKAHLLRASQSLQAHSDSPRLDAEVLLCHVLGKPRSHLIAWSEAMLNATEQQHFEQLIEQRRLGQPVAYLVGEREFWSLPLSVNPAVLVPRADTERLVELALEQLAQGPAEPRVLDLGTGSGAIAVAIAHERPDAHVWAVDISPAALEVAQHNAQRHGCQHLTCWRSDWFADLPADLGPIDLLVSNPPYIDAQDPHLQQGDLPHEPRSALVAEAQGLADLQHIAEGARALLRPGAPMLLEHGWQQAEAVGHILRELGYQAVRSEKDWGGNPRVTLGFAAGLDSPRHAAI